MFFDQLMANYVAQLAHVKDLFAYGGTEARTYFTQPLQQEGLGFEAHGLVGAGRRLGASALAVLPLGPEGGVGGVALEARGDDDAATLEREPRVGAVRGEGQEGE